MAIAADANWGDATIEAGTRLYRITRPAYSDARFLLNGGGGYHAENRYNYKHQPTSYSSDNFLLCISEMLFHMYDVSLRKLKNNSLAEFRTESSKVFELVVFTSKQIDNLIYLDSDPAKQDYQLNPSAITHSDTIYSGLQDASHRVRIKNKDGIVASSARHSRGYVVVLFGDRRDAVIQVDFEFRIELSLLKEDLTATVKDPSFGPIRDRINQNTGEFGFNPIEFSKHRSLLQPLPRVERGRLQFSRTFYVGSYPDSAIL